MKVPPLLALVLGIASFVSPVAAQPAPLVFEQQEYQLQPGQSVPMQVSPETRDFLRHAQSRLTLHGPSSKGLVTGPNAAGDTILLAASLLAEPGDYTVDLTAESAGGEKRTATLRVQ